MGDREARSSRDGAVPRDRADRLGGGIIRRHRRAKRSVMADQGCRRVRRSGACPMPIGCPAFAGGANRTPMRSKHRLHAPLATAFRPTWDARRSDLARPGRSRAPLRYPGLAQGFQAVHGKGERRREAATTCGSRRTPNRAAAALNARWATGGGPAGARIPEWSHRAASVPSRVASAEACPVLCLTSMTFSHPGPGSFRDKQLATRRTTRLVPEYRRTATFHRRDRVLTHQSGINTVSPL